MFSILNVMMLPSILLPNTAITFCLMGRSLLKAKRLLSEMYPLVLFDLWFEFATVKAKMQPHMLK